MVRAMPPAGASLAVMKPLSETAARFAAAVLVPPETKAWVLKTRFE